jgi:hypothetical protein
MITIYRRHSPNCPGKSKGRAYRKCDCAIWVQGTLGDLWQHKTLKTPNWQYASTLKANWEARNVWETEETGLTTIEAAVSNFLTYCESSAKNVSPLTARKYRRELGKFLMAFSQARGILYLKQLDVEAVTDYITSRPVKPNTVAWKIACCGNSLHSP